MRERCAGALFLLLLLVATVAASGDQTWGFVAAVEGRTLLIRSGESTSVEMKKRDKVYPGDRIVVEKGARIHVLLFAKSAFGVDGAASLRVFEKGVDLWEGRVRYNVPQGTLREGETHEVRTRNATVRLNDAALSVETEQIPGLEDLTANVITKVCALRGSVHVDLSSGGSVEISSRECGKIVGDQPDVERTVLAPASPSGPPAATRVRPRLHP